MFLSCLLSKSFIYLDFFTLTSRWVIKSLDHTEYTLIKKIFHLLWTQSTTKSVKIIYMYGQSSPISPRPLSATGRYVRAELSATSRAVHGPSCTGIIDEDRLARGKTEGIWYAWGWGGVPRSNPWVPYLPYLENPNFPIPASFPFCNITHNLLKLLFWMHMHFAYFFVIFFVDPSLQNIKNEGKTPQYCTLELFMTPLKTKKTQTKIGEKKLTLIWLKWSPIAPFTSIFSPKNIDIAGKGPRTPICRREHDPLYKTGNTQAMNLRAPYQLSLWPKNINWRKRN